MNKDDVSDKGGGGNARMHKPSAATQAPPMWRPQDDVMSPATPAMGAVMDGKHEKQRFQQQQQAREDLFSSRTWSTGSLTDERPSALSMWGVGGSRGTFGSHSFSSQNNSASQELASAFTASSSGGFFGVDDVLLGHQRSGSAKSEGLGGKKLTRNMTSPQPRSIAELNALMTPSLYPNGGRVEPNSSGNVLPLLNASHSALPAQTAQQQQQKVIRSRSENLAQVARGSSVSTNMLYDIRSDGNLDLPSPRNPGSPKDRQYLGGGGSLRVSSSPQVSMHSLYKTELCRSWEETGSCRYGSKCQFAHGKSELRPIARHPKYKTEICRTFATSGTCPYGTRCRFIHYVTSNGIKTTGSLGDKDSSKAGGGENLVCKKVEESATIQSSNADTWTELLSSSEESRSQGEGSVRRSKSAYPRLEEASRQRQQQQQQQQRLQRQQQKNKRLPIFQSLSFEERN